MKKDIQWFSQNSNVCNRCELKEKEVALFSNLSNQSIDSMSSCHAIIPPDQVIYEQNSEGDHIYTIKSGIVGLSSTDSELKTTITELITSGMVIGLENINNSTYKQDAISLTPLSICKININKNNMENGIDLLLWENITKKWEERYAHSTKVSVFSLGSTNIRITKLFRFISVYTYIENENKFFMIPLKHISSIIKVSVENCSRALSKMKKTNFIQRVDKQSFTFTNSQE